MFKTREEAKKAGADAADWLMYKFIRPIANAASFGILNSEPDCSKCKRFHQNQKPKSKI